MKSRYNNVRIKSAAIIFLIAGLAVSTLQAGETRKPDVLFLVVDDLNAYPEFIGYYKGQMKTPNIDSLVKGGINFRRAYSCGPECSPSRTATLWGINQSVTGYFQNGANIDGAAALKTHPTLTQWFMQNGYHVSGAGKVYHNAPKGMTLWDETLTDKSDEEKSKGLNLRGFAGKTILDWGPIPTPKEKMEDWIVSSWGIDQLKQPHDKPLFLAIGIHKPHEPWYVPQEYFDRFPLDQIVLPEVKDNDLDDISDYAKKEMVNNGKTMKSLREHDQWKQGVQGYFAAAAFADDCIGRLLAALRESGRDKDTIVVLWTDNGFHLGEKEHWRKATLWDQSTHICFTMKVPGLTTAGSVCDRSVSLLDLYPTLCEVAGIPAPPDLQGTSLVPLLKDPAAPWDFPCFTWGSKPGDVTLVQGPWRYIQYTDGSRELYNHDKDVHEWSNLAGNPEYSEQLAQMAALIPAMQTGFIGNRAENGKHAADNQQKILKKEKGKTQ